MRRRSVDRVAGRLRAQPAPQPTPFGTRLSDGFRCAAGLLIAGTDRTERRVSPGVIRRDEKSSPSGWGPYGQRRTAQHDDHYCSADGRTYPKSGMVVSWPSHPHRSLVPSPPVC